MQVKISKLNDLKDGSSRYFENVSNPCTYSVDSIKRTVHLAFHGLFFLIFQKISIKKTVYSYI